MALLIGLSVGLSLGGLLLFAVVVFVVLACAYRNKLKTLCCGKTKVQMQQLHDGGELDVKLIDKTSDDFSSKYIAV